VFAALGVPYRAPPERDCSPSETRCPMGPVPRRPPPILASARLDDETAGIGMLLELQVGHARQSGRKIQLRVVVISYSWSWLEHHR
jgi:hypothetical protein